MHKLKDVEVIEIRDVYQRNLVSQAELARSYGVSPSTISNVCTGKRKLTPKQ
jgi:plasmid maintenance system antidote protein VapI